jgi:hypothetical protein
VPDDLFSRETGDIAPISIRAHVSIRASASMVWEVKPETLYLTLDANAALALDLDADHDGIGGPDHAVLISVMVVPKLAGPKTGPNGVHAWSIGGENALSMVTSVYWEVGQRPAGVCAGSLAPGGREHVCSAWCPSCSKSSVSRSIKPAGSGWHRLAASRRSLHQGQNSANIYVILFTINVVILLALPQVNFIACPITHTIPASCSRDRNQRLVH